ncbi:MAG: Rpp14/Pop5 family protein [Nitrososphaeraceae archaeon]
MTLKRRYKRRYMVVLFHSSPEELLSTARERMLDMFGHVITQKALLKIIDKIGPDLHVIRCRSEYLGEVLCSLTLIGTEHPAVVLDVSGTLRSLRTRARVKKMSLRLP